MASVLGASLRSMRSLESNVKIKDIGSGRLKKFWNLKFDFKFQIQAQFFEIQFLLCMLLKET